MKVFKLNIAGLVIRFYLLMAVVLVGGFTGFWWIALLALPIFLSAMLGVTLGVTTPKKNKIIKLNSEKGLKKIAV